MNSKLEEHLLQYEKHAPIANDAALIQAIRAILRAEERRPPEARDTELMEEAVDALLSLEKADTEALEARAVQISERFFDEIRDAEKAKKPRGRTLKLKWLIPIAAAISLLAFGSIAAYSDFVKEKNAFQNAADNGGDLSGIPEAEDFKHTEFAHAKDQEAVFADAKTALYDKMLNTIDYMNNVSLTMETSMLEGEVTTVAYRFDIDRGLAYQSETVGGRLVSEVFGADGNMIYVSHTEQVYMQQYLPMYTRGDTPYIPLEDRIEIMDDGIPCYTYRRNITNCPYASYCLVPQELAFSYLKDFDAWEIAEENVAYLGRSCVKIVGVPGSYIAKKHGLDSFTMLVDCATGVLLQFTGTRDGAVSRYMTVTECSFESEVTIKRLDKDAVLSYTEIAR